jgi:purine-nucleoside phosphorylase
MTTQINQASTFIKEQLPDFQPKFGVILGTGLGGLVAEIDVLKTISYEEIPHFPQSTVEFHKGKLILGKIADKEVVCMQGRFHLYEGYSMQEVTLPIRVMQKLGVQNLLVSNAAGGLNPSFQTSDLMIIHDHISLLLPESPLRGKHHDEWGDRFPDMSEPYDLSMRALAVQIAQQNDIKIQTGVYVSVQGPQLETRAEYRFLRNMGADAVGMSTVPEVIVASQMGMKVFGLSVITDMCIPETLEKAEISKILAAAYKAEPNMTFIIKELVRLFE